MKFQNLILQSSLLQVVIIMFSLNSYGESRPIIATVSRLAKRHIGHAGDVMIDSKNPNSPPMPPAPFEKIEGNPATETTQVAASLKQIHVQGNPAPGKDDTSQPDSAMNGLSIDVQPGIEFSTAPAKSTEISAPIAEQRTPEAPAKVKNTLEDKPTESVKAPTSNTNTDEKEGKRKNGKKKGKK